MREQWLGQRWRLLIYRVSMSTLFDTRYQKGGSTLELDEQLRNNVTAGGWIGSVSVDYPFE